MSAEGVALPTIPGLALPSIGSTSSVGGPSSRKKYVSMFENNAR